MKTSLAILAVLIVASFGWQACQAATPADKPAPPGGEVKLVYEAGEDLAAMLTPSKVSTAGTVMTISGATGQIKVAGASVAVAGAMKGTAVGFGMDANGNGTVDPAEYAIVGPKATGFFKLKIGEGKDKRDYAVAFTTLQVLGRQNVIGTVFGRYTPACCWKGAVNGVMVRIIDSNMDGKITQDGLDAIAIGATPYAMPLMKNHQIGKNFYELKVAENGATMGFTPATDLKLATVEAKLASTPASKALFMADTTGEGCYDLVSTKQVPAGEYKLVYGVLASGNDTVQFRPTKKSPTYPLQAGAINAPSIGPKLRVEFQAQIVGKTIKIFPNVAVMGAGNEQYMANFQLIPPTVELAEGNQTISKQQMSFG